MIFGILGSFGIEIGDPKIFGRKNFRRKKSENFWSKNFWDQNFSIFDRKNKYFSDQKKSIKKNRPKFWSTKMFRTKYQHFVLDFFDEKFPDEKNSDHIFRSQMIPRFRKSHLEQRATIIKIRTTCTVHELHFFVLFPLSTIL